MNRERFIQLAARYHNLLQDQEDLRKDIAEFEAEFKEGAALTNPQVATTKRILKAEIKGTLDKLKTKMDDDAVLLAILEMPPQKKSSQTFSSIPHDPETGEILETEMAPDRAVATGVVYPPSDAPEVRDTGVTDDNPCPPIPESMRRYA